MRVGLYGIGGVYNFGCEAIVRGATKLIRSMYSNADIVYFSYNYDYDSTMLADLDINIVKIVSDVNLFNRVESKISRTLNFKQRPLFFDFESVINRVDDIWSIGGDIYTIPEYKRKNRKYEYYNSVVDFCDRAIDAGKKVILYGASVGPFGEYKKAVSYYIDNLKRYKLILCRENETFEYLKNEGLTNIVFFPDPAFQVKGEGFYAKEKKYIGLNFSPLSLRELYGDSYVDGQRQLVCLIEQIIDEFDMPLLMIPHVVSKAETDDDLSFQEHIKEMVAPRYKEKIQIADYKKGFIGLKPQIQQCKFVVSARMHCAINAMVENIPAIILSYSKKSIGMCKYVYGNDEWVMSLSDIGNSLIEKMKKMDYESEEITNYLVTRNAEIDNEYNKLIEKIRSI